MKYKVIVRPIHIQKNEKTVTGNAVFIIQRLAINNTMIDIPHPISSYIQSTSNNVNTQKHNADCINQFLNYIQREIDEDNDDFIELPQQGLCGLNLIHAASYLNYIGDELLNSYKTVKARENTLIAFYNYLINSGILNEDVKFETCVYLDENGKPCKGIVSPFKNPDTYVMYPDKNNYNKINKLKNMDIDIWMMFIETAQKRDPIMAFALYLSFMGGIRRGEIVNLTIDAINADKFKRHLELDICDRQHILFNNRNVNLTSSQVKKPRANQIVLDPFKDLFPLYEQHLKIISEIKARTKSKYKSALFVNDDGLPLTGENYTYRFNKLKEAFLEELQYRSYESYNRLSKTRWGTHIGRGIFTNFVIEQGLCDLPSGQTLERFVANLRGDQSTESAHAYIDNYKIINGIRKNINNLHQRLSTNIKLNH